MIPFADPRARRIAEGHGRLAPSALVALALVLAIAVSARAIWLHFDFHSGAVEFGVFAAAPVSGPSSPCSRPASPPAGSRGWPAGGRLVFSARHAPGGER